MRVMRRIYESCEGRSGVDGGRWTESEREGEAELQRNDIPIPITFNGKEKKK